MQFLYSIQSQADVVFKCVKAFTTLIFLSIFLSQQCCYNNSISHKSMFGNCSLNHWSICWCFQCSLSITPCFPRFRSSFWQPFSEITHSFASSYLPYVSRLFLSLSSFSLLFFLLFHIKYVAYPSSLISTLDSVTLAVPVFFAGMDFDFNFVFSWMVTTKYAACDNPKVEHYAYYCRRTYTAGKKDDHLAIFSIWHFPQDFLYAYLWALGWWVRSTLWKLSKVTLLDILFSMLNLLGTIFHKGLVGLGMQCWYYVNTYQDRFC